ncbi:MAG: histidine kinase [Nocardioidaceae bacterium]|nr:histidine kinase [Nocardioidaceae bacterium]MCL2611898.1 histidine kinase [Nocardioidaceae bacterium]
MEKRAGGQGQPRWAGPWLAGIWLFFLLNPLGEGWDHRHELRGVVGMVATVGFAFAYMWMWVRAREQFRAQEGRLVMARGFPLSVAAPSLVAQVLLGAVMMVCLGASGSASITYFAVSCVMTMSFRVASPIVVVLIAATAASGALPGWGNQIGNAFGILAASLAVFGMRTVMARNIDLFRAHQENAQLAVEGERNRFARDLHDILGHSLTVITVKAELADRLFDVDPERARAEVRDLERLSRDALADVRRAVEGYRDLTLPGEIARARTALEAAEIRADLPNSTDEVPTELRELFAWTVREGVTNVIRHSGARTCTVRLTPTGAEVLDDGCGAVVAPAGGNGLLGLRERAAAVGATVTAGPLDPGFTLKVAVA